MSILGKRMRAAADATGLTAIDIAGKLHTSDVTVRRWWSGSREPRTAIMERYAALVGQEVDWFYRPDDEAVNQSARRIMIGILDLVMSGRDAASAAALETGEGLGLTEDEERMLVDQSPNIRSFLNSWSDQAWDTLSDQQKAWILDRVRAMTAEAG